jgi:hypothetical protein
MASDQSNSIQPIVITNFGGQLTRVINGDMNSGYAKYATSFGYNIALQPSSLSFMEIARSITGSQIVNTMTLSNVTPGSGYSGYVGGEIVTGGTGYGIVQGTGTTSITLLNSSITGTFSGTITGVHSSTTGTFDSLSTTSVQSVITDLIVAAKTRVESSSTNAPTFTGTGINDLSIGGSYTGTGTRTYTVTIATTGSPDTFNWTDSNSGSGTDVPITGSLQSLSGGISIQFADLTGHTAGDQWVFTSSAYGFTAQFVYAIGSGGNVYKIQVNNPQGDNPDYDNPVLLTTIGLNSPTFMNGGSINFYSGYIWIGSDVGVTRINFDGTGEVFVGILSSWVQNVPRPSMLFQGNIYFANGNNIAQITSGLTVTSYAQISPAFPTDYHVEDMDVTFDGVYLVMVLVENTQTNILSTNVDTDQSGNVNTVNAYWNGTDTGSTSFTTIPTFAGSAYHTFAGNEYLFGCDTYGGALFTPYQKALSLIESQSPFYNATSSLGNAVIWMSPEMTGTTGNNQVAGLHIYGGIDNDIQPAHFKISQTPAQIAITGSIPAGDVLKVPSMLTVSNYAQAAPTQSGYPNDVFGTSKIYFSTSEYNGYSQQSNYYALSLYPTGSGVSTTGVYETQTQLFSQMIKVNQVRVYVEPVPIGCTFQFDLIGMDGTPMSGGTFVFDAIRGFQAAIPTRGSYNPSMSSTAALGLRITNLGQVTPKIHKVEMDVIPFGL